MTALDIYDAAYNDGYADGYAAVPRRAPLDDSEVNYRDGYADGAAKRAADAEDEA